MSNIVVRKANTDEWYTMKKDVELITPYLMQNEYSNILCPFDTENSNFVKVLFNMGFNVSYSHISNGGDFFKIYTDDELKQFDCIVSNPPFSKKDRILEKLFTINVPFAMIISINALFDSKRDLNFLKIINLNC